MISIKKYVFSGNGSNMDEDTFALRVKYARKVTFCTKDIFERRVTFARKAIFVRE